MTDFKKFTDGIRRKKIPVRLDADTGRIPEPEPKFTPLPPESQGRAPVVTAEPPEPEEPQLPESEEPPVIPENGDEAEGIERFAPSGVPWEVERPPKKLLGLWGVGAGIAALLVLSILVSTVFARLTVTVTPRTEQVTIDNIRVSLDASSSSVDAEGRGVPAELLEFERIAAADFEAAGKAVVSERARGKVRIYNNFNSAPQRLVAATRFLTDSGKLYRLPQAVIVPGAKIENGKLIAEFLEAEILADQPGQDYNIAGEVKLNIPGFKGSPRYQGFYALAPSGFEGGFTGEARVVAKDDIARAEELLTKKAFDEIREEMSRKIPAPFRLLDAHREIKITEVKTPKPGSRAERFSAEARATGRALVFREDDVKSLLLGVLVPPNSGRVIIGDSWRLEYEVQKAELSKGLGEALVRGEAKTQALVNRAELAALVVGKKEGSLIEELKARQELSAFNLSFFPPWLFSAPGDPEKIKVVIDGK